MTIPDYSGCVTVISEQFTISKLS